LLSQYRSQSREVGHADVAISKTRHEEDEVVEFGSGFVAGGRVENECGDGGLRPLVSYVVQASSVGNHWKLRSQGSGSRRDWEMRREESGGGTGREYGSLEKV
jgi:hypothetical protein